MASSETLHDFKPPTLDTLQQHEAADDTDEVGRIKQMPKEVGVLLVVAGIGGLLLPGPVGSPFVILGGVILWPRAFERVELAFARRWPKLHRHSIRQIGRYLTDMERRYPPFNDR